MVNVATLVKSQFPEIYQDSSPTLIAFLRAYYQWLDQSANIRPADLLSLRDIDTTLDQFVTHFKQKYLVNLPLQTQGDLRLLIKRNSDFYASKGTAASIELLLRILYDVDANIYYPGNDLLRSSAGKWFVPQYLEVTSSDRTVTFLNKQIFGVKSKASAIVEAVVRKVTLNDIVYVSSLVGNFETGEQITDISGDTINAPVITGSLNEIVIDNGGQNNNIGDVFNITSTSGSKATARVTAVTSGTGRVDFVINDGGTGYTTNSDVAISNVVYSMTNVRNANSLVTRFTNFETVIQPLANVFFITANGSFAVGDFVTGLTSTTNVFQANGFVVSANQTGANGQLILMTTTGDYRFADKLHRADGLTAIVNTAVDISATANVVGSNATHIGVQEITNTLYIGANAFIYGQNSNTFANITANSIGSGAAFNIGSITNAQQFFVNTDLLTDVNLAGIPFMSVRLDGKGSGLGNVAGISIGQQFTVGSVLGTFSTNTSVFQVSGSTQTAEGLLYFANTTTFRVYTRSGTFSNSVTLFSNTGNCAITSSFTSLGGTGYSNNATVTFSGGGQSITSITISAAGTGYANGEHLIVTGDGANAEIAVVTNGAGAIASFNYVNHGQHFIEVPVLTVNTAGGSGATLVAVLQNPTQANATIITTANVITSSAISNSGGGYFNDPFITISGGTGANLYVNMQYGYGFAKYKMGNSNTVINSLLTDETVTAGTIRSLANIATGSGYNVNPFVQVIDPLVAAFSVYDIIVNISNTQGGFIVGETVTQTQIIPTVQLTFTGITGNTAFDTNELITQKGGAESGIAYFRNTTTIDLMNTLGTFVTTSNTFTQILGTGSNATANVTAVASINATATATGIVTGGNSTVITIRPLSFNTVFNTSNTIVGQTSAANALPSSISINTAFNQMGLNANISGNVVTANGIATAVQVISSGFGFQNNQLVTLTNNTNIFSITGIAELEKQGTGEGFWLTTDGFLDNDKFLQDDIYYQVYSYEVQTGLSLDRYENVVKDMVHIAGTQLFGKTIISSSAQVQMQPENGSVTQF